MSVILCMTTLFYKTLILRGEIWYWSLLGFKGLKHLPPMNMELLMSLQDINFDCKFYIHLVILPLLHKDEVRSLRTSHLYYQLTLCHGHPHGNFDCSRGMLLKWEMGKWKLETKWRIVNGVTDGARVQVGFVPTFYFLFSLLISCFPFPSPYSPLPTPCFSNIRRATLDSNPHRPLSYQ